MKELFESFVIGAFASPVKYGELYFVKGLAVFSHEYCLSASDTLGIVAERSAAECSENKCFRSVI